MPSDRPAQQHFVHGNQTDARIAQLTFDQCGNFFPQGFLQTPAMMFLSPVLHNSLFAFRPQLFACLPTCFLEKDASSRNPLVLPA